ncbi:MAG: cysteine synthase A [Deferribacterales bacterium]
MKIFKDNTLSIGRTPLVKLNNIEGADGNNIFLKIEGRNPAYSVKCRVGVYIISEAVKNGQLKKGMTVIEATSGNTGIGLAFAGAALGYPVKIVMPETMSMERRQMMQAFGAELILTEGAKGMAGAVAEADRMLAEHPDKYFLANQFRNPSNPLAHEMTTGPEIFEDMDGKVDVFVSAIGTGGTITGVSRYLKKRLPSMISVGVEPLNSPVITQKLNGEPLKPSPHKIQGIGAGFIPDVLDLSLVDGMVRVADDDAINHARMLAKEEGVICGISSGAAVCGALTYLRENGLKDKNVVVILADSGERYLSSGLFA